MGNRIAVNVLWDIVLPFLKGEASSKERTESANLRNKIIKEAGYEPEEVFDEDSFFVPDKWFQIENFIFFKNSSNYWEIVPADWVIFETKTPKPFEIWDRNTVS